jgi:ribose transport system substrate-binding protein
MIFRLIFLVLIMFSLASGCDSENTAKKSLKIAVIPKGKTHQFWQTVKAGATKAAEEQKVKLIWEGPEKESDRQTQIQIVQSFISQNVDALVLAPLDSRSLVPVVKSAKRREIPVIIFDSALDSEDFVSFVATNNYQGGVFCAEIMAEKLKEKGNVAILRYMEGSASTTNREQGFLDRIGQIAPKIKIISSDRYAGATYATSLKNSQKLLADFPRIDGVFTANEMATHAMLDALIASGKIDKVRFVGFDANNEITKALEDGKIEALGLQDPFQIGYEAVTAAVKTLKGEEVKSRIETRVSIATKQNLHTPEVQVLLYPPIDQWLKKHQ